MARPSEVALEALRTALIPRDVASSQSRARALVGLGQTGITVPVRPAGTADRRGKGKLMGGSLLEVGLLVLIAYAVGYAPRWIARGGGRPASFASVSNAAGLLR
jgi:hypothetical protein